MSKKMTLLVASVVVVVLGATATALAASTSASNHSAAKSNSAKNNKGFAGLVDIGGGRQIYMECRGKGRPTVVFVSGLQDRAETWSTTLDSSGDPVFPSKRAVLPAIAETSRVCAYDRPGTILPTGPDAEDFLPSRSDPVEQPTTLQDDVDDLHALLKASGERGPYVVVGHSMGGAISRLYAKEHPEDVSGLVLVDPTTYESRKALTDDEWALWKVLLGGPPSKETLDLYEDLEWKDHQRNMEQALAAAKKLKPMPFVAFQSDEPFDLTRFVKDGTFPTPEAAEQFRIFVYNAWHDAIGDEVSQVPGARFIDDPRSGHYIHQERPRLVIRQIRDVVEAARKKSCSLEIKNHGQCVKAEKQARR